MKTIKFLLILCILASFFSLSSCAQKINSPLETTSEIASVTSEEFPVTTQEETTVSTHQQTTLNYTNKKCIWLSQFDLNKVYTYNSTQREQKQYRKYIEKILDNVKENGFNTIIVQVRPYADSMYPSEVYPMSSYVVGAYGNEAEYDPFEIMIEEAHSRELSVQAWINPMRGMLVKEIANVPNNYKIKEWYLDSKTMGKYLVVVSDRIYLNPAYPEVRQLIVDGAVEIIENYNIDGLHMDDYFYPTTDASFDNIAFSKYKADGGKLAIADFRRDCLSTLVHGIYESVKSFDENLIFGISPAGNINTVFEKQYADVYLWCSQKGYIDYICPQVYFGLEHQTYDFKKVSNTFQNIIKTDSVELIIGMTLGKAKSGTDQYAGTGKNEWSKNKDILERCLDYTLSLKKCTGVSYFCYQYFYDPLSGASVTETKAERDAFIPKLKTIEWKEDK